MYDARDIANWFVNRSMQAGRQPSIMTLLKLVYIAHGWYLEINKRPLFHNQIQAWKHGPVIPDVYRDFRNQGIHVNSPITTKSTLPIHANDELFLEEVYNLYGHLSPFKLSDLTHTHGGPWHIATQRGGNYAEIPNDLILQHYEAKRRTSQANGAQ